jgi:hypothetical protein
MNAGEHWSGFCKENAAGMSEAQNSIIAGAFSNRVLIGHESCLS